MHSFGPKTAFEIKKNIIALENLHDFLIFISTYLHINSVLVELGIQKKTSKCNFDYTWHDGISFKLVRAWFWCEISVRKYKRQQPSYSLWIMLYSSSQLCLQLTYFTFTVMINNVPKFQRQIGNIKTKNDNKFIYISIAARTVIPRNIFLTPFYW